MRFNIQAMHAARRCLGTAQYSASSSSPSTHELRLAKKLLASLHAALSNDGLLNEGVVKEAGVSFHDVRLSNDGSKASVLYSSWRDDPSVAERALLEHTSRLKQVASRALKSRRMPYLEFVSAQDDAVAAKREAREEIFRRLDEVRRDRGGE